MLRDTMCALLYGNEFTLTLKYHDPPSLEIVTLHENPWGCERPRLKQVIII